MPLFRPIRARHYRPRPPVNPLDRKVSTSILVLVLGFILILAGTVVLLVSSNPQHQTAKKWELVVGGIVLGIGVIVALSAGCFYRKFYGIKKERQKEENDRRSHAGAPTVRCEDNRAPVSVISADGTASPLSIPIESPAPAISKDQNEVEISTSL